MVKAALGRTARFEATWLAAAIFRTALIAAAVIVAARLVSARFASLRRSVFGRREVSAAYARALRSSATMASTAAAPASATATIAAAITTTITAAAVVLAAAIAATAGAWRVILSGIVVRRKVLGRGGVRIGLALLGVMSVIVNFGGVGSESFVSRGVVFYNSGLLIV